MEGFIFISPDGEVYKKEFDGTIKRHGPVAKKYMDEKKLPLVDVDPEIKNGFYWGKELAKNHSRFVIQNSGRSGAIYIPSELTDVQKIWIQQFLLTEIRRFNGLLIVCDFIGEKMNAYDSSQYDVVYELEKCLKLKGVNINLEVYDNDIGNKRRYT